ncbi:hypothetical protein DM826_04325 [Halonotius aquaticus]|uniref:DUF1641 domain-containing protein n=1 Tax=Halonotius aquaticus TaxID=2216978 RepID=A0A3A6PTP6_9EURY|nr:DUF1641 domain-containing protein [Halonotius aquaticus]RJX43915.1 hypothetical protein DM826_04325 [Halonotius aquaticus]
MSDAETESATVDDNGEADEASSDDADDAINVDTDGVSDDEALEAAIAENPEAVADFVRRLDAVNELLDVVTLGEAAMTDEMVVELTGTAETLAASADGVATDETIRLAETVGENGDDLTDALETVLELQRDGTLDDLAELGNVAGLANAALTDEMVVSLAGTGSSLGELADTASDDDTREGLKSLLDSVGAAEQADTSSVGAIGLARGFRDPEIKQGLGYLFAVAKALGQQQDKEDT